MLIIVFVALALLFLAKVVWNVFVPIELLRRRDPQRGISLMPGVELLLVFLATLVSWAGGTRTLGWRPLGVAGTGLAIVLASYALGFVIGMIMKFFSRTDTPRNSR